MQLVAFDVSPFTFHILSHWSAMMIFSARGLFRRYGATARDQEKSYRNNN